MTQRIRGEHYDEVQDALNKWQPSEPFTMADFHEKTGVATSATTYRMLGFLCDIDKRPGAGMRLPKLFTYPKKRPGLLLITDERAA